MRKQSWANGKITLKFSHTFPLQLKYFVKTSEVEKVLTWIFHFYDVSGPLSITIGIIWSSLISSPVVLKRSSSIDEMNQALKFVLVTCVVRATCIPELGPSLVSSASNIKYYLCNSKAYLQPLLTSMIKPFYEIS